MVRQRTCGNSQLQQQARSQAQTQAQTNALQQQNALLNQQLASQSISHIQHLQQLIPQHWPPQQTLSSQVPVQPEPPSPKVQPAVPPPTPLPFNSDEMLQKMRMKVQADWEEALKKFKESPPVPLVTIPPTPPQPQTLPSVAQPSNFPGPSQPPRRSRSPAPTREHHRDNKRPISIPLSPPRRRPIPTESRGRRRRSSRPRREGSLRLRPVSPDQRSPSYDFSTATHTHTTPILVATSILLCLAIIFRSLISTTRQ